MVDGEKLEADFRDEGKHTGRNDLLYIQKMMWKWNKPVLKEVDK